ILFRFVFVYLVLYNLPFPLQLLTFNEKTAEYLLQPYEDVWHKAVIWVGERVFDVQITIHPTGSGDTMYKFVQMFCFLVLSASVSILWSLLDRRWKNYARLHRWLVVYIRFVLAYWMFVYGSVKVIQSQFPGPTLDRML